MLPQGEIDRIQHHLEVARREAVVVPHHVWDTGTDSDPIVPINPVAPAGQLLQLVEEVEAETSETQTRLLERHPALHDAAAQQ